MPTPSGGEELSPGRAGLLRKQTQQYVYGRLDGKWLLRVCRAGGFERGWVLEASQMPSGALVQSRILQGTGKPAWWASSVLVPPAYLTALRASGRKHCGRNIWEKAVPTLGGDNHMAGRAMQ